MADDGGPIRLVLLAQAGDRAALGELFLYVQAPLHAYLARVLCDDHLAEDVLQDVFVIVWRKLWWLREPELFRPWVYRIASREAFRRLRKERFWVRLRGEPRLAALPAAEPPETIPREWLEALPDRLAALTPASRAVLLLHYLEGLTLDEVAAVLALPAGTVKSRLAYGLAALRRQFTQDGDPR
jgi:RNA polymerase sigma-70 factor (ECF subfamily)